MPYSTYQKTPQSKIFKVANSYLRTGESDRKAQAQVGHVLLIYPQSPNPKPFARFNQTLHISCVPLTDALGLDQLIAPTK